MRTDGGTDGRTDGHNRGLGALRDYKNALRNLQIYSKAATQKIMFLTF